MRKIPITEIHLPPIDTQNGIFSKDKTLLNWLIVYVEEGLKNNSLQIGDIIPNKSELAKYHGVSTGTVQNAIRIAEDLGYFISRQHVGTMIAGINKNQEIKPKSKKDVAKEVIKRFIVQNKFKKGDVLPAARIIANEIYSSQNTVRLALDTLTREGILQNKTNSFNKSVKILNVDYKEINIEKSHHLKSETLTTNLYVKIKDYIAKNYKIGDKIITNKEFAKIFNVSVRTINSAMKKLNKEKIVVSLRGQYGTRYINNPEKQKEGGEKSKFMSLPQGSSAIKNSYTYNWQRVLDLIKKYMITNHETGDKLPSMKNLAKTFNVSSNTVKKAVNELRKQGILFCQRGKYGGIYIIELPPKEDAFTWLSLNPKFLVQ